MNNNNDGTKKISSNDNNKNKNNGNNININNNNNNNNFGSPLTFSDMHSAPVSKASGGGSKVYRGNVGGGGQTAIFSSNNQLSGVSGSHDSQGLYFNKSQKSQQQQQQMPMPMLDSFAAISLGTSNNNNMNKPSTDFVLEIKDSGGGSGSSNANGGFFVPSKICLPGRLRNTPAMINDELNSVVCTDSAGHTLYTCQQALSQFGYDVEFTVDEQNFIITGMAFPKCNEIGCNFKICIFRESAGTRCVVTRDSGDPISFNSFYSCLEGSLGKSLNCIRGISTSALESCESGLAFPSMPSFSLSDLDSFDFSDDMEMPDMGHMGHYSVECLDGFARDLTADEYQLETLGLVFDLDKKVIVNSHALVQAVTVCCQSCDLAVQRLALKIMQKLEVVVDVQSQCAIIQKYIGRK